MDENTNRTIIINSFVMYARMFLNTILALISTRFVLAALGESDFGLFSLVGSVISFMGVFNTIMLSTASRFITVAVGRNIVEETRKIFNVCVIIFYGCAFLLLALMLPLGYFYIGKFVNYSGSFENVSVVFLFSTLASIVSTISTPYNSLLIAKERFIFISLVDVIIHVFRCVISICLVYWIENKLFVYTICMAVSTATPTFCNYYYCKSRFPEVINFYFTRDLKYYKDILKFSGWVSYGAVASIVRMQSVAIILNLFFGTVINAAVGIAYSINTYIILISNNILQSLQPQITKNYVLGNIERTETLLVASTKFSFLCLLLVGVPFFISGDWILNLWLKNTPEWALSFTLFLIIDNLVASFNSGLSLVIFADGRIAMYQFVINTLRLLGVIVAFFSVRETNSPTSIFYVYILFSVLIVVATQICLRKTVNISIFKIAKESYFPCLTVLLLCIPIFFIVESYNGMFKIIIASVYVIGIEVLFGLSQLERNYLITRIRRIFKRSV